MCVCVSFFPVSSICLWWTPYGIKGRTVAISVTGSDHWKPWRLNPGVYYSTDTFSMCCRHSDSIKNVETHIQRHGTITNVFFTALQWEVVTLFCRCVWEGFCECTTVWVRQKEQDRNSESSQHPPLQPTFWQEGWAAAILFTPQTSPTQSCVLSPEGGRKNTPCFS